MRGVAVGSTRAVDRYVTVDWSASNSPNTGSDSVWICALDADGAATTKNPATRGKAERLVREILRNAVDRGERVLVGFDFPYGYPAGLAAALGLGGEPWRAVWDFIAQRLADHPDTNRSNQFKVAAEINSLLADQVFWGCPPSEASAALSSKKDRVVYRQGPADTGLAEWREVEATLRSRGDQPQPAWKLYYTGSVGSQVLTGIPVVARLRHDARLADVSAECPFEVRTADELPSRPAVVHAEIWPSLIDFHVQPGQVEDEAQVICLAREFQKRDQNGNLATLLTAGSSKSVAEEGWILGVA